MTNNPLKKYFRQPAIYLNLPTLCRWYTDSDVDLINKTEIPIYGLSAIDDILLNTPDAMLNGQALEKVISHCVPSIKNVKKMMIPDIEAIYVAIKIATGNGKHEYDRICPKCKHENNFEINCQTLIDKMSYVDDSDLQVQFNEDLMIYIKPYTFEMKHIYMQKEFEEEKLLQSLTISTDDEFEKARLVAESVDRLSRITFDLVSMSIEKVHLLKENVFVEKHEYINEWLISITKSQADAVMKAVKQLNDVGIDKRIEATCQSCNHTWSEVLNFDPTSFFGKRS